jgi:hypothetical protein
MLKPQQPGQAVQAETMQPVMKAPGTKRLKLDYDKVLSTSALKLQLAPLQFDGEEGAVQGRHPR